MGPLPRPYIDLLRIAVAVYLVDRTTKRARGKGNRWERSLEVAIPLSEPQRWESQAANLAQMVGFLTGDRWEFQFTRRRAAGARVRGDRRPAATPIVCLFSGGADSLCGALLALSETGVAPHLVSHWDWTVVRSAQMRVRAQFAKLTDADPTSEALRIGRRDSQIGSGVTFVKEDTSRSRSLLFLALGLASAHLRDADLWMPENGFLSLNVPLAPERRASLSTRTTHPRFLGDLRRLIQAAGITVTIRNPFEGETKGEVFGRLARLYNPERLGRALSETYSCARSDARLAGFPPAMQCGVCYACLVRRAAFAAANVPDQSTYIELATRGDAAARTRWLTAKRLADYETVRYAVARGFDERDILSLGLPPGYDLGGALGLARRGLAELSALHIA